MIEFKRTVVILYINMQTITILSGWKIYIIVLEDSILTTFNKKTEINCFKYDLPFGEVCEQVLHDGSKLLHMEENHPCFYLRHVL